MAHSCQWSYLPTRVSIGSAWWGESNHFDAVFDKGASSAAYDACYILHEYVFRGNSFKRSGMTTTRETHKRRLSVVT